MGGYMGGFPVFAGYSAFFCVPKPRYCPPPPVYCPPKPPVCFPPKIVVCPQPVQIMPIIKCVFDVIESLCNLVKCPDPGTSADPGTKSIVVDVVDTLDIVGNNHDSGLV